MLTEVQAADAYAGARERCRRLVVASRDNACQWQRVKPDSETTSLADLDCQNVPTHRWAAGAGY